MVKERADHLPVVLFTKESMDADKPVPVAKFPPVRFIDVPIKQVRTGNVQGDWCLEISVAAITTAGVPVEEALVGILMKSIKLVINLECDGKAS